MSYFAPAGTPVTLGDIARGATRSSRSSHSNDFLAAQMRRLSSLPHAWLMSSGRAALTVILRAMSAVAADPRRDEVIVPAYTCYSVAASIARAGLRPRLCDIDADTLGICPAALERCDFTRVLAVTCSNLYGIPDALAAIERIARERRVFMLDDAAQALGATLADRPVGSFGDAGLYSFDKGKIICTMQGGAIVCPNGDLNETLSLLVAALPDSSLAESLYRFAQLPIYALCLRPSLYELVRKLSFLGLGRTVYETGYPIARLGALQAGVGAELAGRLAALNEQRRGNAARLSEALADLPGVHLPRELPHSKSVYARFPVRVPAAMRDELVRKLDHVGIGATASYPRPLADVPEIAAMLRDPQSDVSRAREVASQIVTLPTHAYCPSDLGERVRFVLADIGRSPRQQAEGMR